MQIYLPIAEMAVQAETILALGLGVGFLSGIFGVGGGFLTTPFLIFLGIPPAVAVGTQPCQLIASSTTGVISHWKRDNVDLKMAAFLLFGGFWGTLFGSLLFSFLSKAGHIDIVISLLYVLFLGGIGMSMLIESILSFFRSNSKSKDDQYHQKSWSDNLPYKVRFRHSQLYISALLPIGVGLLGGFLVSILGIGAGFLLVPAMIYILRMPPILVAGTSLFQIIFSSIFATYFHAVYNQTLDLILALILISGGVVGAQLGVRVSVYIKGSFARILLATLILSVGLKLGSDLLIEPSYLFKVEGY
jgi:uncharacterized membrane protein YfcA